MTDYKLITGTERRRRWSVEEKKQINKETYLLGQSVSQVSRKYGITPSQFFLLGALNGKGSYTRDFLSGRTGTQKPNEGDEEADS